MRLIKGNVERIAKNETQIRKLMSAGFQALEKSVDAREEQRPVEKMKVDELKAIAKEKGIEGAASLTKEELVAVLKEVV